jgi:hypothetical protein
MSQVQKFVMRYLSIPKGKNKDLYSIDLVLAGCTIATKYLTLRLTYNTQDCMVTAAICKDCTRSIDLGSHRSHGSGMTS